MLSTLIDRAATAFLYSSFGHRYVSPTQREVMLIDEFRSALRGIDLDVAAVQPSHAKWLGNSRDLRQFVLEHDPRRFLRAPVIKSTMVNGMGKSVMPEFAHLKRSSEWKTRWRPAIQESPAGDPLPFFLYPSSSVVLVHHAYHLARFEEKTRRRIEAFDYILEFGGGYGSMCRLVHKLGFKGQYVIFDLPTMSALQRYFLAAAGVAGDITCTSDIADVAASLPANKAETLFLATWSLSESPVDLRVKIHELVQGFKAFLIAYQESFEEVNNTRYFDTWTAPSMSMGWYDWPIPHMPGNRYLHGARAVAQRL